MIGRLWRALVERFTAPRRARTRAAAAEALAAALAEHEPARRVRLLAEALAYGERLADDSGAVIVMEASLHLGEKLRALGRTDEALEHFARAVQRSFRVADPVGRQRRAGVLTRLAILDQEAGQAGRARARYREALALGGDTDSPLLLGMLTQAAFNLGLLETDAGDDDSARASWEHAIALGERSGHPSGWDPASVAAFNLGHLLARHGDRSGARAMLETAGRMAEPSGTPLGLMAASKSELALAGLTEGDGLDAMLERDRHHARAVELGRASQLPEGLVVAAQATIALGEAAFEGGRVADGAARHREALAMLDAAGDDAPATLRELAGLRLGSALAELGEREEADALLARVVASGRAADAPPARRELAVQAACARHRVLVALERWDDAREAARAAGEMAKDLEGPPALVFGAAAKLAGAHQRLHDGDRAGAVALLAEASASGWASGEEPGRRLALDAQLLAGQLERHAGRMAEALALFRDALARSGEHEDAGMQGARSLAALHAGHCLVGLERMLEARHAYERALALGRTSGVALGRASAANAALNLASLLEDEVPRERLRELFAVATSLGRSSRTPLGEQCADAARKALERLDGE